MFSLLRKVLIPMMDTDTYKEEYMLGVNYRVMEKSILSNPYERHSFEWLHFNSGWIDQDEEASQNY